MYKVVNIEPGRPARPGQLIIQRRLILASSLFLGQDKGRTLLDLGCGNGAQTLLFTPHFERVIGVDLLPLNRAENPVPSGSFDFLRGEAARLPLRSESIDSAISFEVLEHTPDDELALKEVHRVLRKSGIFLFTVPNKWWIFESHGASVPLFNWIPWNRIPFVGWLPRAIHERFARARTYTMRRARRLATQSGFAVVASGYITAPLDVLPDGSMRRVLRASLFKKETTGIPLLAVNLYVYCRKV